MVGAPFRPPCLRLAMIVGRGLHRQLALHPSRPGRRDRELRKRDAWQAQDEEGTHDGTHE
jgi:hypothetical protein